MFFAILDLIITSLFRCYLHFQSGKVTFFFTTDQMTNEERQPSSTLRTNHFNPKRLRDKE